MFFFAFSNYSGRFSDACRKLGTIGTEWKKILEENKEFLSEELEGDINSDLGKVKLLLESKLPQFGELLYAYLLKDEDATIILSCDLEGWWDVAVIQVNLLTIILHNYFYLCAVQKKLKCNLVIK